MHELVSRQLFGASVGTIGPDICLVRGWTLRVALYPTIEIDFAAAERQWIRARFGCDGWNGQPPSVLWLDLKDQPLASLPQGSGGQVNSSIHPLTGRPFTCMPGVREYHTYPSHVGDVWENYKGKPGYDLGGIITQVWRAWQATTP